MRPIFPALRDSLITNLKKADVEKINISPVLRYT